MTREEKLHWIMKTFREPICSLNSKPASLYGANLDFCIVSRRDSLGSMVTSWDQALTIITQREGKFIDQDNQEDLRQLAEGRKEIPGNTRVTIRHKPIRKK